MKRTNVTYGQLDRVLRSFGFTCRLVTKEPPARVYEHQESGAYLTMPPFPETDLVVDYHLAAARATLEVFGIAEPEVFDAKIQKRSSRSKTRSRGRGTQAGDGEGSLKRTAVTYGQLDKVLRSLGFTCRVEMSDPPARLYEHQETGARIRMPSFPDDDRMLEYHLVTARVMLDQFGIADPKTFDTKLQKAG